ncbi:hypothetical protein AB3S75_036373 [Citrus x aurantiifolia]
MTTSNPFTTATTPSQAPPQQHMYQNQRPANPNHSQGQAQGQGVVYPVASSGRGFIPKPMRPSDQTVTVANHGGYPPRPNQLPPYPRPHLDNHHHPVLHHHHMIRPPPLNNQQHQHPQISSNPSPIRGVPVSSGHLKVAPSSSASLSPVIPPDSNGYNKHLRDKSDETFTIVRDRKVRITEGASLYALCRSWLRNGSPEETQPQHADGVKSLPRPLPMPTADANIAKEKESEEDEDETDEDENVDRLSEEDLLRRHVQRAKQIRARLSNERAKRIERYKTRLSLLLPPLVEQSQNDAHAGS